MSEGSSALPDSQSSTPSRPVVQIGPCGAVVHASAEGLTLLADEFSDRHFVHLPQLIEPQLLGQLSDVAERAQYSSRVQEGIGVEHGLSPDAPPMPALNFLSNSPKLFEVVTQITGCGRIGCFDGRVYQILSSLGHYDTWHGDDVGYRVVAMSLNLSRAPYEGVLLN